MALGCWRRAECVRERERKREIISLGLKGNRFIYNIKISIRKSVEEVKKYLMSVNEVAGKIWPRTV